MADYLNKLLDAYFDYDKAELRGDAQSALNTNSSELRSLLQEFPNTKFVVEGSCDERGSAEYNLALGERRAKAAKEFLTQIGVPAERLTTISYGQERPVGPTTTRTAGKRIAARISPWQTSFPEVHFSWRLCSGAPLLAQPFCAFL